MNRINNLKMSLGKKIYGEFSDSTIGKFIDSNLKRSNQQPLHGSKNKKINKQKK